MSKGQGKLIGIKFTENLIGDVSGLTPNPVGGVGYTRLIGATVTASSTPTPVGNSHTNVVDGDVATCWYPSAYVGVSWLNFRLAEAARRTGFRYYVGHSTFYPTAFNISGSNDGSTFTTLGSFTGGTSTVGWHEYTFTNSESYLYYRFTITSYSQTYPWIYEFQFLEPLGNEKTFNITGQEYNFVPEGALSQKTYLISKIYTHPTEPNSIILETPDLTKFENVVGDLTIVYDGTGNLMGLGGPVLAFSTTFTPTDLIPKPDQNDPEHLELTGITATSALTLIHYYTAQEGAERIEISNISATSTLTKVSDL